MSKYELMTKDYKGFPKRVDLSNHICEQNIEEIDILVGRCKDHSQLKNFLVESHIIPDDSQEEFVIKETKDENKGIDWKRVIYGHPELLDAAFKLSIRRKENDMNLPTYILNYDNLRKSIINEEMRLETDEESKAKKR